MQRMFSLHQATLTILPESDEQIPDEPYINLENADDEVLNI